MSFESSRLLSALALLCSSVICWAVPPANDDFANRVELFLDSPDGGPNIGATAEVGEPIPAGYDSSDYQGTIWYEWTNPIAFSDIYEINTAGSDFNTVLAVWKAVTPTLGDLQLVHVNNVATDGNRSRIRFTANGDQTYYISVAGKGASRGNVSILVTQPSPGLVTSLNSVTPSPSSPNVTSAAATVTTTVNMGVRATIISGFLRIFDPSRFLVTSTPLSVSNRISGSNAPSGNYQVSFSLPRYLPPGTYYLALRLQDTSGNIVSSYGWNEETPFPNGITSTVTVVNTGAVDTYTQWLKQFGINGLANTGQAQDYDKDGTQNLAEFASGADPLTASTSTVQTSSGSIVQLGLPKVFMTGSGASQRLRVEYSRRLNEPLMTTTVQFSEDLVNWTNAINSPTTIATGTGYAVAAVEDQVFDPLKTRRFARLLVTYTLPP